MPEKGVEVVVKFDPAIPTSAQGPALLQMERSLREATKLDVRVVKHLKGDDSKLRVMMSQEQRDKL